MNKLLNNLLGMYKQAKMKKSAMIIDEILDRKDGASYNPQDFYDYVSQQLDVLNSKDIARALDSGTEEDVKKALCEYIKLGEYNPAICDYINSVNWLEEEDVEKWFSIKLSDEQAKEFAKLLTENNIKNKSKKEGEEIRVSFFLLPSSIGVAQGLLAATLSKFPDKQASTIKRAEEDLIEVGWGLDTSDEDMIESIAEDTGRKINKNFWEKINKDIDKVESWFLRKGYKNFFTKVRDEGHGKDNELGGTAWMTKQQLEDYISQAEKYDENSYMLLENTGSLYIDINHDDALEFHLFIYVDDKDLNELGIESKRVSKNKKLSSKNTKLTKKAMKKSAGYSNNSDYFGDWFGEGQIDFSKIINPNDEGKVWMVKLWGGSGYILDVYLVKANDFYDATNKVFEWSYENEGVNKNVFDREHLEKEAAEYYKDEPDMFGKKLEEEDFIDRFLEEYYVGNEDYSLFARAENFFAEEVPEEYLKGNKQSSKTKAVAKQAKIELVEGVWYKVFGYPLSVKYLGEGKGGMKRFEKADGTKIIFDADVEIEPYEYSYSHKQATKKKAVLQESENGLGYVLPNGSVVYPGDEKYLQSELKGDKELLEKTKSEIVRLEKEMEEIKKEYPEVDLSKYPDSILFKLDRELKLKEGIELSIETIEDILNAFKNKKMGKQATIKHENGVYNVYSESGKCLGKGYKTKEEAEKRLKQVEYFKHKNASRRDWEFPGYETEPIDSRIEWLYTHNVNYNNTQYDYIWKLRETLKGEHVDFDEKGEKVYLNKDDIEDILYYLKHHNKNYRGDQYWIIDDLKVEDFIKNLKSNKRTSLKQVVISKMAKIKK